MNLHRKLERLERQHRAASACPLCARGIGVNRVVVTLGDAPPALELYACPICGAVPENLRVVRVCSPLSNEQLRVLNFLQAGPADSPRARALAAKKANEHASGRSAANAPKAQVATSRRAG